MLGFMLQSFPPPGFSLATWHWEGLTVDFILLKRIWTKHGSTQYLAVYSYKKLYHVKLYLYCLTMRPSHSDSSQKHSLYAHPLLTSLVWYIHTYVRTLLSSSPSEFRPSHPLRWGWGPLQHLGRSWRSWGTWQWRWWNQLSWGGDKREEKGVRTTGA